MALNEGQMDHFYCFINKGVLQPVGGSLYSSKKPWVRAGEKKTKPQKSFGKKRFEEHYEGLNIALKTISTLFIHKKKLNGTRALCHIWKKKHHHLQTLTCFVSLFQ